jgi:hypothetical protein
MIPVELDGGIKSRVWFGDEIPNWTFRPIGSRQYKIDTRRRKLPYGERSAAVELLQTGEAGIRYGALGATFHPRQTDYISVYLHSTYPFLDKILLADSLAKGLDAVYIGLPSLGATGVEDALSDDEIPRLLGSGTLRFPYAAYGRSSSSREIFEQIASIVFKLIALDQKTITPRIVKNLFKRELFPAVPRPARQPEYADPNPRDFEE